MTRTEAEEYIAKQGLELVVNNEYGKIWDTPDRRLYEQLLQLKEYGSLEYRNALEGEDR